MTGKWDRSGQDGEPSLGSSDLAEARAMQVLRMQAEETAWATAGQMPENLDVLSPETARLLLHELRVHQIELEMQNEELRRAQLELEASQARYFDLYDLAPVGYFTLSDTGMILEANLTAATLLGVARAALARQPLSRFIYREDQDIYYRHRKLLFETGAPQVCELRLVRNEGAPFWARLESTFAQDDEGAPVRRVVMSNIDERKEAEAERERLLAAEQGALALAEKAIQLRDEFISIAAHELKTPVTSLWGFSQILIRKHERTGILDPVLVTSALMHIDQQSKKLNDLVGHLLDVSRLEAGKLAIVQQETPLASVVDAALASVRVIHTARTFVVRDPASVWACIDTLRMEQVIINLLDNAARFSPKDAPVEIDISLNARGEVVISVRDHGEGISEKDRQRVFERFYQAQSRQHRGGMGLGLYISAQIVEMHGGTISYEAPEGEGSRFVVRLPASGHDSKQSLSEQRSK
jgi:PAS domain S-box-containing protein